MAVNIEFSRDKTKDIDEESNPTGIVSLGVVPVEATEDAPASFDQAIVESGFGRYNLILIFLTALATCANIFESSTMSYILPIAECDLHLTLTDKGILNSCAYAGMTISAIPWGYLADTKGRRKALVYGYLLTSVCVFCSSLSQNFLMLVIFKFLGGLFVNGPAAILFTYLTEMHGPKHRSVVLMVVGMMISVACLLLPLLAWGIFPRDWDFILFDSLNIHSWQIFLFVCGLPSLITGSLLYLMPESPKFLMSQGRNTEALQVLQRIYHINTGKPGSSYPIRSLALEASTRQAHKDKAVYTVEDKNTNISPTRKQSLSVLRNGLQQIKPIFHKPLLGLSLQCYTIQFCMFLGINTVRLWLPQLFASMADYEEQNDNSISATMCTILEYSVNKTAETLADHDNACAVPKIISIDMYTNNIIVAASNLLGYFVAVAVVRIVGAKCLLTYGLFISGFLGMGLYWSVSSLMTIIISSAFVTVSEIAFSSLMGTVNVLFPTQLRSLVVSTTMMCGRLGGLSGNLLFPVFIQIGCLPPFIMIASVMFLAAVFTIFIPNPSKANFS